MDSNKLYEKAHNVSNEIIRALKDGTTIDECENVKEFLANNSQREEFMSRITSEEIISQQLKKRENSSKEKAIEKLILQLQIEKNRKKKIVRRRLQMATSIAAALFFISFFIYRATNSHEPFIVRSDIDSTFNVPTLITENGERIDASIDMEQKNLTNSNYRLIKSNELTIQYVANNDKTQQEADSISYNTLIIPSGYNYSVTLSDGTEVKLNAGATLRYPTKFSRNNREVHLQGEAYFNVSKAGTPFIVNTKDLKVKVYGTKFNVRGGIGNSTEAVLLEGSIGILLENGSEIMMTPDQQYIYNRDLDSYNLTAVNSKDYVMWTNNMFRFKDRRLNDVLYDISAWYKVQFNTKIDIEDMVITLVAGRDEPLSDILPFIEKMLNVKIIKEGKGEYSIER